MKKKTMKYKEKVRWKSAKTAISGIFPAFSAGKIRFSKIELRNILGIAILHQCAKFHEKNIKYSSRNTRNTVFPVKIRTKSAKTAISGIFRHFRPGKKLFSRIGLGHVLCIPNTHLWAENQEKQMMKSLENAKKPVFPAYFRHFRPEKYVFRKSGSVTF